jgi:hypothetical protein
MTQAVYLGESSFRRKTEALPVKNNLLKVGNICFALLLVATVGWAQGEKAPAEKSGASNIDIPGRFFDMKIPEGFKAQPVEEGGILKWTKDSGEIFLIVGDLFHESGDLLFKELRKAADKDNRMEEVRTLRIKGARALLYKEKAPKDTLRLRAWRLIVIANKKIIDVEFSAPAKEFDSFVPEFDKAVNSFKLKAS